MSTPCTERPGSVARSLSPVQSPPRSPRPSPRSPHCLSTSRPNSRPSSRPSSRNNSRPNSRAASPAHSNCSDCSVCVEGTGSGSKRGNVAHIAQTLLSPMFGRKVKKSEVNGTVGCERSGLQSPLVKRSEKMTNGHVTGSHVTNGHHHVHEEKLNPGLPGGDSGNIPSSSSSSPKEKKSSKWRIKLKTSSGEDKGDKCSETSSYSSLESGSVKNNETSRTDNKRKKTEKTKKSHSRGSSFDYRLIKDMFKISLPRSLSAGELGKKEDNSIAEIVDEEEKKGMKSSKSSLKLKNSFKAQFKSSKTNCSDIPDGESGLSSLQGNGLVGLKNLGNTCFMNSILQCLSHSTLVREYFLSKKYKLDLSSTSKMQGRLAEEFASLLHDMWSGRHDSVSPNKFKSAVAKSAPRFVGYSQQDSQEFLRFFMEGLHEDLNKGKKGKRKIEEPPKGLTDLQLAEHRWSGYTSYDNSAIVDIFVGLLKSTLTCSVCDHKSVTFDPFWDLSLPLPRSKTSGLNLQSCFAEFTQEEILDGDEKPTCENCKKRQKCTKQFSIERFPPILVLHLKRFSEVRYRTKLSTKVDFPIENLDLSDLSSQSHLCAPKYDLVGVSNHSGNTFSGHYIAYCKVGSRWHRFSDSSVSSISRNDIVSSEAYVLFYERQKPR